MLLAKRPDLNENRMKTLPHWPFLAFQTIVESASCTESMSDWGTNPQPRAGVAEWHTQRT